MNANTIPLQEAIPWSPTSHRSILVSDSIETDGRFVLSTMVAHLFSSSHRTLLANTTTQQQQQQPPLLLPRALWLSGNASTEQQIAATLKKLGCDAGAAYLRTNTATGNYSTSTSTNSYNSGLTIRSLVSEASDRLLSTYSTSTTMSSTDDDAPNPEHPTNEELLDREEFLKSVYRDVKDWIYNGMPEPTTTEEEEESETTPTTNTETAPTWIIVDDATALASVFGESLLYRFVENLLSFADRRLCGILLLVSGDVDQMLLKLERQEHTDQSGWFGGGGLVHKQAVKDTLLNGCPPWERAVEESVDGIIDVLPLGSGFSREAHGKLVFSEPPNGRGWNDTSHTTVSSGKTTTPSGGGSKRTIWNKRIFNYRIQDNGARAIRLRER